MNPNNISSTNDASKDQKHKTDEIQNEFVPERAAGPFSNIESNWAGAISEGTNLIKRQTGPVVIAIANQKGGVAKTTTVVSLGGALARHNQEVLLVDLNAQANLTLALGNTS